MRKAIVLLVFVVFVIAGTAFAAGLAIATPPSSVTGTFLARGVATEKVKTRGNQPYDAVVQHLVIAPGGHTGWHTHPGTAIAVIVSGTLTIYDGDDRTCTGHSYTAGQTYVDPGYGHVHLGRNEGTEPLEIYVTYLDVDAGGGPVRIDAPDPGTCT